MRLKYHRFNFVFIPPQKIYLTRETEPTIKIKKAIETLLIKTDSFKPMKVFSTGQSLSLRF
jgi:hypothetical protein